MHLKRQKVPKTWPIPRKGTKYVVRASRSLTKSLPILIILRDILKLAENRKEVKKAIGQKSILLNGKPVRDEKTSIALFDVIEILPLKKSYRLGISEKGKFQIEEINQKEKDFKIAKIIGKKILRGKKTQINLEDGNNFLYEKPCKVNDSAVINLKKRKIEKILPLKEKRKILVTSGKHAGMEGTIKKVKKEEKMVEVESKKGETKNVLIKHVLVVE